MSHFRKHYTPENVMLTITTRLMLDSFILRIYSRKTIFFF